MRPGTGRSQLGPASEAMVNGWGSVVGWEMQTWAVALLLGWGVTSSEMHFRKIGHQVS